jgi:hypothetical protein
MSYSFNVRSPSHAAAKVAVSGELDRVIQAQPIHARDRAVTETAVANLITLTHEPGEGQELHVSVAGSCYGREGQDFDGVSLSVQITCLAKTS